MQNLQLRRTERQRGAGSRRWCSVSTVSRHDARHEGLRVMCHVIFCGVPPCGAEKEHTHTTQCRFVGCFTSSSWVMLADRDRVELNCRTSRSYWLPAIPEGLDASLMAERVIFREYCQVYLLKTTYRYLLDFCSCRHTVVGIAITISYNACVGGLLHKIRSLLFQPFFFSQGRNCKGRSQGALKTEIFLRSKRKF